MAFKQKSFERLKEKIAQIDTDLAIDEHDLRSLVGQLKKDFRVVPGRIGRHLAGLRKKIVKLGNKEDDLYTKADTILKGIDNARS